MVGHPTQNLFIPPGRTQTRLKQALQCGGGGGGGDFMVEGSLLSGYGPIVCSVLDLWIPNSALKKVYILFLFSISQGVA